ncbi:MAG: ATP phosphoribosyltransferase regulatory subunit, partial [Fusicatenibacter sp.]|nr:ATP phosphoribosyltransferase regulatory subunit [Fusicatenibacter sp.]
VMLDSGLKEFQVSIGHNEYFKALAREANLDEEHLIELRELISIKNQFGAMELLDRLPLRDDLKKAISEVPQLFGTAEILEKAKNLTSNPSALKAVSRLETIYEILKDYGYEKYISFDFGLLSKFRYYTGIIFQAFTYGTGEPIAKGGRYDNLLEHFGKKAPAVGFCIVMESLINALERQKIEIPVHNTRTMILYPDFLQPMAVKLAVDHRKKGMDIALVCFGRDKVLADYKEYGRRNQFGGIVYIQKKDSVLAINLATDEVQQIEL